MAPPPKPYALVPLALALSELGCKPACEEAGLRSAAEAFATHALERRQEGFAALEQACPTLPPMLGRSLMAEFDVLPVDQQRAIQTDRPDDPAWRELLARTCPHAPAEHDRATRRSCALDRYELLAPDDVFIDRDLTPFMLYEWLVAGHVDRGLAHDVVWPLLSASASAEELEALCLHEGLACEHVVATWDLELPRSSMDVPPRGRTTLFITATRLSVARAPLLRLDAGRPAPDAFVHHVSASLREALATHAAQARAAEHDEGMDWDTPVTIIADRTTPFRTLADGFFTATKAGFSAAELVVLDGHELHAIPVSPSLAWLPPNPDARRLERPLDLTFAVHRDRVEATAQGMTDLHAFPNLTACEPSPAGCYDLEGIAVFVTKLQELFPSENVATFRVDDDVPLQAMVALLDVVRGGEACTLSEAFVGEAVPRECRFFQAILDTDPPLYFHVDRAGTLALGKATVIPTREHPSGVPAERELLAAYATAREDIVRCFAGRPERAKDLDEGARISVMYGRAKDDPPRTTARVLIDGFADDELERCILAPLGVEPDRRESATEFVTGVQVELAMRTHFETKPSD